MPYTGEMQSVSNKSVVVCMDATNISNVGMATILRNTGNENLIWKWSKNERNDVYVDCLKDLENLGYFFRGFVIDGRAGLKKKLIELYPHAPIQHCIFHQIKTVRKYLPRNVQSDGGKILRKIGLKLTKYNAVQFNTALDIWYVLYRDYINEKTYSYNENYKRRWWYTHKSLRSAYRSLKTNLPYLFTFEKYKHLNIPKTTNICEGYFSHLKDRLNRHRGLNTERKFKMANYLLSINLTNSKKEQ